MKCKVCNKDLFVELDFRTLFLPNYKVHESCRRQINEELKTEVIPIENNTIVWHSFFDKAIDIQEEYVEMMLMGKALLFCMENQEWSIVLWMTYDEYNQLDKYTQFFLLKLGDQSIVFLSLFSIL